MTIFHLHSPSLLSFEIPSHQIIQTKFNISRQTAVVVLRTEKATSVSTHTAGPTDQTLEPRSCSMQTAVPHASHLTWSQAGSSAYGQRFMSPW